MLNLWTVPELLQTQHEQLVQRVRLLVLQQGQAVGDENQGLRQREGRGEVNFLAGRCDSAGRTVRFTRVLMCSAVLLVAGGTGPMRARPLCVLPGLG